jgi:tetratricopeptide (TPR) repeat protein
MKNNRIARITILLFSLFPAFVSAQLTTLPSGGNKKAMVAERVGLTDITVTYSRPGVKGREGKIWGDLVPYGLTDPGYGMSTSSPWRAGANEATKISFSDDVKIEGRNLPKGEYALFIDLQNDAANIIFNKNTKAWGHYFYNTAENVLVVPVKTENMPASKEWLSYEFMDQTEGSAVIALLWEKKKIPFKVEVDVVQSQLASFRRELTSDIGFDSKMWAQAAQYCADHKVNLEEALRWSDYSLNGRYIGEKTFSNLSTRANVLNALNRTAEADVAMKDAINVGNENELHMYARQQMQSGNKEKAIEIFILNAKKHPNTFTTNMGMVRAYSAKGDFKNALKTIKIAQSQAPDQLNKDQIAKMIPMLESGKDIN